MAGNITMVKEGSYRLRYKDYTRNVTAKSGRAAEKLLAAFIVEVENGNFTKPSKITFGEFVKKWLEEYAEGVLAPGTLAWYKRTLNARILPRFGQKRLDEIKPLDLLNFYNTLRGEHDFISKSEDGTMLKQTSGGLSSKSIRHHHGIIFTIFEKAMRWNVYQGQNPARHVDTPKVERKKAKCYDLDQIAAMLKALENEDLQHKAAITIALTTGMRLGELMGLEWVDVDTANKSIEVRQASQHLTGKGTFLKAPKNESSVRKISVNDSLLDIIKAYKEDQQQKGFLCANNNRLFVNWKGEDLNPGSMAKWFPNFLIRHKLPRLNFHGLRHYVESQVMESVTQKFYY